IHGQYVPQFTGPCYLRRSWPYPKRIFLPPAGHIRTLADLQTLLWEYLCPELFHPDVEPDLELLELTIDEYDPPIFIVFCLKENENPDLFPDSDLLQNLKAFHSKVKLLLAVQGDCEDFSEYSKYIEPKLANNVEKQQLARYTVVKNLILTI
ncbi:MAG: hypothetical protein L0Y38_04725, partial [Methylococcaceae bacterium]|nr:hypothetical protein [Methylococcaceae bacterium]